MIERSGTFLEGMMKKMRFAESWVTTIMQCATTVKYKFKFSGTMTDELIPGRGIL